MTEDQNTERRREQLYQLLGRLPDRSRAIREELVAVEERPTCIVEHLYLDLNGIEQVPAYFLRSKAQASEKAPLIIYHHSHGGRYKVGKEELFEGAPYLLAPYYGEALTAAGYSVLAIDSWVFGERSGRSESSVFKEMLWHGRSLLGMMLFDSLRAVDYAVSRPDVDGSRIGTLGMSMGSTMACWLSALDTRVKVTVDLCCMTDYHALMESGGLDLHGLYYYVPDLLTHFTTSQVQSLIAPRPHLSLAGNLDTLTPTSGLELIDQALRRVYEAQGASDAWKLSRYEVGHEENAVMRQEVMEFLNKWL
ncbi:MAG: hydrolase [Paenibacillus sp.]|nr:hydrolase [Paenibacillus sp.]